MKNFYKYISQIVVIFLIISHKVNSQSLNTTLVGDWLIGDYGTVKINNNIAYYANGTYLETVDLSLALHPIELGKIILTGNVKNISFKGNYAYVATDKDITVLDISNPSKPIEINKIYNSYSESVVVNGNYAYILGAGELDILDISNPVTPHTIGKLIIFVDGKHVWWPLNLTLRGNFAYVAAAGGMYIINISDPSNPIETSHIDLTTTGEIPYLHGIVIKSNYAYVGCGAEGLRIIDISAPKKPVLTDSIITGGSTLGIDTSGNYLYVSSIIGGLGVVDISNPSQPSFIGNFGMFNGRGVAVGKNYCVMTDAIYGLTIFDISNPTQPNVIMYLMPYGYGIDVSGNYAYLASGFSGLHIFNISDPKNISKVGYYYYSANGYTEKVKVVGNYAYVANGWGGLSILDISNPANPIEIGNFNFSYADGIAISGNYAYLTDRDQCLLRIIDISNPQTPSEISQLKLQGGLLRDVIIKDDYAYIAADSAGIYIVDITNPTSPKEVDLFKTEGTALQLAVNGNYIYVADGGSATINSKPSGLSIIDISNPYSPIEIGHFYNDSFIIGISISNNYAYVLRNDYSPWKMYILDIYNPYHPIETGYYLGESTNSFVSYANQVCIISNYAYIGTTNGLYIIQNDLITINRPINQSTSDSVLGNFYNRPYINYIVGRNTFDYYGYGSLQNWDSLRTKGEKIAYLNNILPVEYRLRKEQNYTGNDWTQSQINTYGISNINGFIRKERKESNVEHDSTLNAFFNIPVVQVKAFSQDSILTFQGNGILIGDDPLKFKDWYFYNPTDSDKEVDLSNRSFISIGLLAYINSQNNQNDYVYLNDMIKIGLENGVQRDTINYQTYIQRHNPLTAELKITPPKDTVITYKDTLDILNNNFGYPEITTNLTLGKDMDFWGKLEYNSDHFEGWVNVDTLKTIIDTTYISHDNKSFKVRGKTVVTLYEKDGVYNPQNPNGNFFKHTLKSDSVYWNVEADYITDVKDKNNTIPKYFNLSQNFPNPFNPTTAIQYAIPKTSFVTIKVYDILGKEIKALVNEEKVPGYYLIKFNAEQLSSGIYFYRMQAGSFTETKKLILMK